MSKVKKIETIKELDINLINNIEPEIKYRIIDIAIIDRLNKLIKTLNLLSEAKK